MAPPQDFGVTIEPGADRVVVRIRGDLDMSNADVLTEALTEAGAVGGTVVADLSGVTFMDSSALSAVVASARALAVVGQAPRARRALARGGARPRDHRARQGHRRLRRAAGQRAEVAPMAEVQPTTLQLRMPADPQLLRVLRLVGSGLASLGQLDLTATEEVRVAVDELGAALISMGDGGPIELTFDLTPAALCVEGTTAHPAGAPARGGSRSPTAC